MLIPNYYTILKSEQLGKNTYLFHVTLNGKSDVYQGHFPDNPIVPGVCSIQMIKDCVQLLLSQESICFSCIKQCRFYHLLRPVNQELQLIITLLDNQWVTAEILENDLLCMRIKAQYKLKRFLCMH